VGVSEIGPALHAGGIVDTLEKRFACHVEQRLAGQAPCFESNWDYTHDLQSVIFYHTLNPNGKLESI